MLRKSDSIILMVAILLLVMWLGSRQLNADGVWFDEWWSWYVAGADSFKLSRALPDIWARIQNDDIRQGVVYPLLLAGWGSLVGWSEYATRALSLFSGLVMLAAVYRLGAILTGRRLVGVTSSALLAVSVWFVYFLHEMRVYMLMAMLATTVLLFYVSIMQSRKSPGRWLYVALFVSTGLLLNTHYFSGVFVGVLGGLHLLRGFSLWRDTRWRGVLLTWMAALVWLLPILINLSAAVEIARHEPRTQPDLALMLEMGSGIFIAFSNNAIALLLVLLVMGLMMKSARALWVLIVGVVLANLSAYYLFSLNELRYNMVLLPLLALAAGFGLYELHRRRIPWGIVWGAWAIAFWGAQSDFNIERVIQRWPSQPIREMASALSPYVAPDDVVLNLLAEDNRPTLALHPLVHYMGDFGARLEVIENSTYPGVEGFAQRVDEAVQGARRVWLVNDPRWETPEWALTEYLLLADGFLACGTVADVDSMRILAYAQQETAGRQWLFNGGVLHSYVAPVRGGVLPLWLFYQLDDDFTTELYSVALHVLDSSGQLVMQQDVALPQAASACQLNRISLETLPVGAYALHLAVYNWQTGERLIFDDSDYPLLALFNLPE